MFIPIIIFLASAVFGSPTEVVPVPAYEEPILQRTETLGEYVGRYFSDTPVLADIAWCESRVRHLDTRGNILRGEVDSDDIGIMQINTRYHQARADELDLDIYSLDGNLGYAAYLYEKEGTRPWRSSEPCWGTLARN